MKKKDSPPYRAYQSYKFKVKGKSFGRVKGPDGLDISAENKDCAGCLAMWMNIAYEQGRKSNAIR